MKFILNDTAILSLRGNRRMR